MNFLKYSKLIIIINNNNSKNKNQVTKTGTDPGIFDGGGGASKLWFRKDF